MTNEEFLDLLDKWTESPEYEEYEDLCEECDTLEKQLTMGVKIIELLNKALNNEYGKKLIKEPKFLEIINEE